jgi:hypothetical protein
MKMPYPNSRQRKITNALLTGVAISPQEAKSLLGSRRLTLADITEMYRDLVVRGCAEPVGQRIRASAALLARYSPGPKDSGSGSRVPPREMPEFRPLSRCYMPSSRGLRPGSNDMREVPSHYPPQPQSRRPGVAP